MLTCVPFSLLPPSLLPSLVDPPISDNLHLFSTSDLSAATKVGRAVVFGSLILVGPRTTATTRRAAAALSQRRSFKQELQAGRGSNQKRRRSAGVELTGDDCPLLREALVSVSCLGDGVTVIRFCCCTVEEGYGLLAALLEPVQSDLGYSPFSDRVAATRDGERHESSISWILDALAAADEQHQRTIATPPFNPTTSTAPTMTSLINTVENEI